MNQEQTARKDRINFHRQFNINWRNVGVRNFEPSLKIVSAIQQRDAFIGEEDYKDDEKRKKFARKLRGELRDMGLSPRTVQSIWNQVNHGNIVEIHSAAHLTQLPDEDLLDIRNFGPTALRELRGVLPYANPRQR